MKRTFELTISCASRSLETVEQVKTVLQELFDHHLPDELSEVQIETRNENLERLNEVL